MKEYQKYLNEKMGGFKAETEEHDLMIGAIANAVVKNENDLQQYVSKETIQSADGLNIVKELFSTAKTEEQFIALLQQVMEIEALWEYDSEDVKKALYDLRTV
jgi:hypothetical protein